MVGVPWVAAETDEEARRLATTVYQRALQLVRGEPLMSRPPVTSMEGLWSPAEREMVEAKLALAIVGGPQTVCWKLAALLEQTQADELIFTSDLYLHSDRLRSFEILAEVLQVTKTEAERKAG
jgi:alkanesulfonate monooxygenase SsuD/methylene tetrahydromethanopterin reductase-like flavin-dependent oxidoreductase (luciferase family)